MMQPYVEALCADIAASAPEFAGYEVVSVFFGGGTPTVLPASQLLRIFDAAKNNYRLAADVSVTTEANPETVDFAYLAQLRQAGFNRISFGVQSFDDRELAILGRVHSAQKAVEAMHAAADAGFENINVDLMYALPHQNLTDLAFSLDIARHWPVTHVSCYALTVEEGTPLAGRRSSPLRDAMPDEDVDRQMYQMAKELLEEQGYEHYEISNWARPGFECRHNIGYWTHRQYMGFGIGAHGFVGGRRICKTDDLRGYIGGDFACTLLEEVDKTAEMTEFMILGLRLIKGVDIEEFKARFGCGVFDVFGGKLKKFEEQKLIDIGGGKIALTPLGIDISNTLFAEFL